MFNMVSLDFKLGIYWFSYRINDLDYRNTLPYSTDYTKSTYQEYCSKIQFVTRTSNGHLLDRAFFCESNVWTLVQISQGIACLAGLAFMVLLLDNVLVWQGYSKWFHPTRKSDTSVGRVRKLFKSLILLSVGTHFVMQTFALLLIYFTHL